MSLQEAFIRLQNEVHVDNERGMTTTNIGFASNGGYLL